MKKKKKEVLPVKVVTAQEHIGLHGINADGILATTREDIFAFVGVRADDSGLLDGYEAESIAGKIYTALEREKYGWQLISLPHTVDITSIVNNLVSQRSEVITPWKLRLLDSELEYIREIVSTDSKEVKLFFKLWSKFKGQKSVTRLKDRASELAQRLSEVPQVTAWNMDRAEVAGICRAYSELLTSQSKEDLDYITEQV